MMRRARVFGLGWIRVEPGTVISQRALREGSLGVHHRPRQAEQLPAPAAGLQCAVDPECHPCLRNEVLPFSQEGQGVSAGRRVASFAPANRRATSSPLAAASRHRRAASRRAAPPPSRERTRRPPQACGTSVRGVSCARCRGAAYAWTFAFARRMSARFAARSVDSESAPAPSIARKRSCTWSSTALHSANVTRGAAMHRALLLVSPGSLRF